MYLFFGSPVWLPFPFLRSQVKAKSPSRSGSRGSRGANGAMSPERELPKKRGDGYPP